MNRTDRQMVCLRLMKLAAFRSHIRLKSAYDPPAAADGKRIFVDARWPQDVAAARAKIDLWLSDAAPASALLNVRECSPQAWTQFRRRYEQQLRAEPSLLEHLREQLHHGDITLVFATPDRLHNCAVVLKEMLAEDERARQRGQPVH